MVLRVEHLSCERDDRSVLCDVSFTVAQGELLQVRGPNGSGKTTLLRCLVGLFSDYEGRIWWGSALLRDVFREYVAKLLYLGHQPGVKLQLTALENLQWYSRLHTKIDQRRLINALHLVGLQGFENILCEQLSEGQKKRVALARLLVTDAQLWVLDEPFASLDAQGIEYIERLLYAHIKNGGSVIVTAHHDLAEQSLVKQFMLGSVA